jgi:hypothetical protein
LEQQGVERYLDNQFYENVNSPRWRDHLRASLGFCHEHAWLAVDKRLGDPLGFTIVYHDIVNGVLNRLDDGRSPGRRPRRWASVLTQIPEPVRRLIEKTLAALRPRKHCPACEHRDELSLNTLATLVQELRTSEMMEALQASEGLCLPHLRLALEHVREASDVELLLSIQRARLNALKAEMAEFIRKSDYQVIQEGFGREGDAWLRAIRMMQGDRRGR